MADTEVKPQQGSEKPAPNAPVEPDIDSLLTTIPQLKDVFTEEPAPTAEQPKTEAPPKEPGAQEAGTVEPEAFEIPEGLKPEEEPKEEPKKEEFSHEKVQKRIDELTAKRKAAEEHSASLEAELKDLRARFQAPPPLQPTAANPLSDVETKQQLEQKRSTIQEAKDWCLQNWDGGNVEDGKGGTKWVDAPTVRSIYANADKILARDIPTRDIFLTNRAQFETESKKQYPALYKEGSEAFNTRMSWYKALPECRNYPDIDLIIGDALVGQAIRQNRYAAQGRNGKVPPAAQMPLSTPAPAASPRVPQQKVLSGAALHAAFEANPEAAMDNFVDGLIQGAASQRSR